MCWFTGIFWLDAELARREGGRVGPRVPASARSSENVPVSYPRDTGAGVWTDNKKAHLQGFFEALWRTRTADPLLTMEVLYQLS